MTRRYWMAGAAALVVQVVVTAVLVTNAHRRPPPAEEPPGQLVSAAPVLAESGVQAPQRFARLVLTDRASYAAAAAPFAASGLDRRIEALAGTSNTGHLLFHHNVGCDSVSGPQLRVDDVGAYFLAFDTRRHHLECVAPQRVVVAFVHP